jgi:hypothetical protein
MSDIDSNSPANAKEFLQKVQATLGEMKQKDPLEYAKLLESLRQPLQELNDVLRAVAAK